MARSIRIVFGTIAGLMLVIAVGDVMLSGRLTIVSPASFGALLTVALAFLVSNILNARERQTLLTRQANDLRAAAQRSGKLPAQCRSGERAASIKAKYATRDWWMRRGTRSSGATHPAA